MTRRYKDIDVFRFIDMHDGDLSVCWEWQGRVKTDKKGDSRPYFSCGGKQWIAYRLVFNLFHPDEPLTDGEVVRHTCDNSICCNPTHHERGTHEQNMADMRARQRHGLTHHAVRAIKTLLAGGLPHSEIAKNFGVSRETITAINNDRIYKDVSIGDNDDDDEDKDDNT